MIRHADRLEIPDQPVRSFVALPCPPGLREAIAAARREWQRGSSEVRWTRTGQLHVTLRFLGRAGPLRLPRLDRALAELARRAAPLAVAPAGTGAFPDWRRARVLWLGVDAGPALERLAAAVEAAARGAGFEPEERPFRAHLTLGRVADPRAAGPALAAVREWSPGTPTEEVAEIVLYESELGPGGARHTALARYPLGGPA